jgi:hypothetical protein
LDDVEILLASCLQDEVPDVLLLQAYYQASVSEAGSQQGLTAWSTAWSMCQEPDAKQKYLVDVQAAFLVSYL